MNEDVQSREALSGTMGRRTKYAGCGLSFPPQPLQKMRFTKAPLSAGCTLEIKADIASSATRYTEATGSLELMRGVFCVGLADDFGLGRG
jgi:hypothetical protein